MRVSEAVGTAGRGVLRAALTHTRIHWYTRRCIHSHSFVFVCIRMYAFVCICILMHSYASFVMNIQPSFESLVEVYSSDGQPILVASSLTDCAKMERFLLDTSACF